MDGGWARSHDTKWLPPCDEMEPLRVSGDRADGPKVPFRVTYVPDSQLDHELLKGQY